MRAKAAARWRASAATRWRASAAIRLTASAAALFLGCSPALAKAFATIWQPAQAGYHYSFPKDYGAHERYQSEWWYYTGNVADASGRRYGFELTFFRSGVQHPVNHSSAWDINDLYAAHFALSDPAAGRFFYFERTGRAALGMAGASAGDEHVWIGSWAAERLHSSVHSLQAREGDAVLALRLAPLKPAAIHGRNGISKKGLCASCASHYYSFPRLAVRGSLTLRGHTVSVSGLAWNDHEWGSDELQRGVVGWDWFSLQLDDGSDIMLYLLRRKNGGIVAESSGTFDAPNGSAEFLPRSAFSVAAQGTWRSSHSGAQYPSGWRIRLARKGADLQLTPLLADQELITAHSTGVAYWEGACRVQGSLAGKAVSGFGYTELTGYSGYSGY